MLDASFDALFQVFDELKAEISSLKTQISLQNSSKTVQNSKIGIMAGASESGEAEMWAHTSRDWAEHMPDTIPDNSLAVTDVSGDHWSARWWANYAARAVQARTIVKGYSTRYLFFASAGQLVFTGPDHYGVPFLVDWDTSSVEVFVDGVLMTPVFDYSDAMDDRVTLVVPASEGQAVEMIVVRPFDTASHWSLDVSSWVFNDVNVTFPILDVESGLPVTPDRAIDVMLSLDGVWLKATEDYVVSGTNITFTSPPRADSQVFGQVQGNPVALVTS
jgi:hypothetical protein